MLWQLDWTTDGSGAGWLCVACEDTRYAEPVRTRSYYPVMRASATEAQRDYGPLPAAVREYGAPELGIFVKSDAPAFFGNGAFKFQLTDGGKTQPIRYVEDDVPAPKTRCPVRWRDGRWEKCLARRGWVLA